MIEAGIKQLADAAASAGMSGHLDHPWPAVLSLQLLLYTNTVRANGAYSCCPLRIPWTGRAQIDHTGACAACKKLPGM
jgi:hypothetical protein